MWKITSNNAVEEDPIEEPVIETPPARRIYYKVLTGVSYRNRQFYADEILPDNLVPSMNIAWLLKKKAIEKIEE